MHYLFATDNSTAAAVIAACGTVVAAGLGLVNTYLNSRVLRGTNVIREKAHTIERVVDRRTRPEQRKPNGKRKGVDDNPDDN